MLGRSFQQAHIAVNNNLVLVDELPVTIGGVVHGQLQLPKGERPTAVDIPRMNAELTSCMCIPVTVHGQ